MTKQEKLKKSKLINLLKNNNNTNLDELLNNNNISTLILELLSLDEFIEYNLPLYRYSGDKIILRIFLKEDILMIQIFLKKNLIKNKI